MANIFSKKIFFILAPTLLLLTLFDFEILESGPSHLSTRMSEKVALSAFPLKLKVADHFEGFLDLLLLHQNSCLRILDLSPSLPSTLNRFILSNEVIFNCIKSIYLRICNI